MIGAIIQARTSSTRLPGKVLLELPYGSGITVLQQVIRRLKQSKKIDTIVVATTEDKADDAIVDIASREGVSSFRGSKENVLERYYLAAKTFGLDTIVRITSDCPCIDASLVDATIGHYYAENADYSSISATRTFPHGLDNEVFSFAVLEMAYKNAAKDYEKEHVTPYIYKTNPDKFKISFLDAPGGLCRPDIRVTLDTEEDYVLLCAVFDYLYGVNQFFDAVKIVSLFDQKPWLALISRKVIQKKVLDSLEDEVAEALRVLEFQDLGRVKDLLVEYVSKNESGHPNRSW
jgi:spore coat polysaccharide biosynthesis protein SpsF